jgi:hypothetical protein
MQLLGQLPAPRACECFYLEPAAREDAGGFADSVAEQHRLYIRTDSFCYLQCLNFGSVRCLNQIPGLRAEWDVHVLEVLEVEQDTKVESNPLLLPRAAIVAIRARSNQNACFLQCRLRVSE